MLRLGWIAVLLLAGCADAPAVQVQLLPTGTLVLDRDLRDAAGEESLLTVTVFDVTASELLFTDGVRMTSFGQDLDVPTPDLFVEGNTIIATVQAESTACARNGRIVGRSQPVTWTEDGAVLSVALGCANEIGLTPTAPLHARIGHSAAPTGDGRAVIAGGAARIDFGMGGFSPGGTLVGPVEVYDPATGRFEEIGAMANPRLTAGDAITPAGEVALFGGIGSTTGNPCFDDFEVVFPAPRSGPIDGPRCAPTAMTTTSGVAVVGGKLAPPLDPILLDASLAEITGVTGVNEARSRPALVPLGELVLIVGGGRDPSVPPLRFVGLCEGAPCTLPATGDVPPDDWHSGTAALALCDGGAGGGAVYVFGGETAAGATNRAWCMRVGEGLDASVTELGSGLIAPRTQHLSTQFFTGNSMLQLLVIGGLDAGGAVRNAEIYRLEGCSCQPMQRVGEPVPLPPGFDVWALSQTATLGDGSVLIVGAARGVSGAPTMVEGLALSALFFPDLMAE